jgi:hypothetical protein
VLFRSIETTNEWNNCTQFQRESNRSAANSIKTKLNLMGLDLRDDCQINCNFAEIYREKYGTGKAFELRAKRNKLVRDIKLARADEKNFGKKIPDDILSLKVKDEIVDLAERDENNEFTNNIRNNLAMMEHQRWDTFYLANDWTKLPIDKISAGRNGRQDKLAKQHACITTFKGLNELMTIQKNAEKAEIEKTNKKQFIEAESLLNADTIRHDFNTMDFLLDLCDSDLEKLRAVEGNSDKQYIGILSGSGFCICKWETDNDGK